MRPRNLTEKNWANLAKIGGMSEFLKDKGCIVAVCKVETIFLFGDHYMSPSRHSTEILSS